MSPWQEEEFIFNLYSELKKEVDEILCFGACNKKRLQLTKGIFFFNKKNPDKRVRYDKNDKRALSAIIAIAKRDLKTEEKGKIKERVEKYFLGSYLYGTGTCVDFSICGAILLARRYKIKISMESINSKGHHTYLKIHAGKAYVFDFWSGFFSVYNKDIDWNESVDIEYIRNRKHKISTDIIFSCGELRKIAQNTFTKNNYTLRQKNIESIKSESKKERQKDLKYHHAYEFT